MLGRGTFHFSLHTFEALHEQVFEIPANAIDGKQTQVMNMEISAPVSISNPGWVDAVQPVL